MRFFCPDCGTSYPTGGLDYRCACGGLFALERDPGEKIPDSISLGERATPLLTRSFGGLPVLLKLDYLSPTGSFKDRGARALVSSLAEAGVREVVEDSSGNAGAAIAGYCAAAGIACHIYLPQATSPGKIAQIKAYGATVHPIPGSRDDTARAVLEAAKGIHYASHVYNPLFFAGVAGIASEIAGQAGIPDYLVVPAGNGTMLLGAWMGFRELGRCPRIIAVQSASCAPVHAAFHGLAQAPQAPTVAEGIAVGAPMRRKEMVAAVRASGGDVLTVDDAEVMAARQALSAMGIYVEPTAGVNLAGAIKYFAGKDVSGTTIAVPLTGFGLKK